MRELLTGDDLFADLKLQRDVDARTFLLLEGDSDCAMLDAFIDEDNCLSMPGYGKSSVLQAMKHVNESAFEGAIALIDRDLDDVRGLDHGSQNIVMTDRYDLDAEIFLAEGVANRAASLVVGMVRPRHARPRGGAFDFRTPCVEAAAAIGLMRLATVLNSLDRVSLAEFPIHAAIDPMTKTVVIEQLLVVVSGRCRPHGPTVDELRVFYRSAEATGVSKEQLCCGHDLIRALRWFLGSPVGKAPSLATVEAGVRGCLNLALLSRCGFYQLIDAWAHDAGRRVWVSAAAA